MNKGVRDYFKGTFQLTVHAAKDQILQVTFTVEDKELKSNNENSSGSVSNSNPYCEVYMWFIKYLTGI